MEKKEGTVKIPVEEYLKLLELEKKVIENSSVIINRYTGFYRSSNLTYTAISTDELNKKLIDDNNKQMEEINQLILDSEQIARSLDMKFEKVEVLSIEIKRLQDSAAENSNIIQSIPEWVVRMYNKGYKRCK